MIKITTIKGTAKQFKNMFNLVMCGSKYPLFSEVIMKIDDNVISVNGMDSTRAVGTNQKYMGFEINGNDKIPIDTVSIIEAIKLFDDSNPIVFDYKDNKVILSTDIDGKKDTITIPCPSGEIGIKSNITFGEDSITIGDNVMEFDAKVEVDVNHLQNQIKKGTYVSSMYHEYKIEINENELVLSVGDMNKFESSSRTEITMNTKGTAHSKFMHGYDDVIKALSGNIMINLNDDKPMLIVQTTDEYSVKYLIAPMLNNE